MINLRKTITICAVGSFLGLLGWFGLVEWAHNKMDAAVAERDLARVKFLVAVGVPLERRNEAGDTPLLAATRLEDYEICETLLKAGADPNSVADTGETPLHLAALHRSDLVARVLLDYGAKLETRDIANRSPLDCAIHANRFSTALLLRRRGAKLPPTMKHDPLLLRSAIRNGNLSMVEWLASNGVELDIPHGRRHETALHTAIRTRDASLVRCLLDHGASIQIKNRDGEDAQTLSKRVAGLDVIRLFDPDFQFSKEALNELTFNAVRQGDVRQVESLLMSGAVPEAVDEQGGGLFHLTAQRGSEQLLKLLHDHGTPFNSQDHEGNSPLHLHAVAGNLSGVRQLLAMGADPNIRNARGETAAVMAARSNTFECAQDVIAEIIKGGGDINATSNVGYGILHWAVRNGNFQLTEWLIDMGADTEIGQDKCGTPLYWAVSQPLDPQDVDPFEVSMIGDEVFANLIRLLINRNADIQSPNFAKDTPAAAASRSEQVLIREALLPQSANLLVESPQPAVGE